MSEKRWANNNKRDNDPKPQVSSIKKKQKINDISFNSIKLRYLNSAGTASAPSSPEKKERVSLDASNSNQSIEEISQPETLSSKNGSPKKVGKFGFLTDLEVNNQIQTIVNNEMILKNLLLSIVSSVKTSKTELQELTKFSKSNNEELLKLISTFDSSKKPADAVNKGLDKLYEKISDKFKVTSDINESLVSISSRIESFEPILEKLKKDGGFLEAKQTEMTYNIIRANRAEALSILQEIGKWKEAQEVDLKKIEHKLISAQRNNSTKDDYLLLNNLSQIVGEQLHQNNERTAKPLTELLKKLEKLSNSLSDVKANTESNKSLAEFSNTFSTTFSGQVQEIQKSLETYDSNNNKLINDLFENLKNEMKKALVEKLVTDEDMKLLNDRLNKWSGQVDKNISQLLVSSLNSKFLKVLSETVKSTLQNNVNSLHRELAAEKTNTQQIVRKEMQRVEQDLKNNFTTQISKIISEQKRTPPASRPESSNQESDLLKKELEKKELQNQLKEQKIRELQYKVAQIEDSSKQLKDMEKIKKSVTSLESKKQQLKTELKYLNDSYSSRYNEYEALMKRHNELLSTFNNVMFDKYKNIFGASAMVLLNKNSPDSANNVGTPYTSPSKSSFNSPKVSKKVLSPIKNRVVTSNVYSLPKGTEAVDELRPKDNMRNLSLNLSDTQEEKENRA